VTTTGSCSGLKPWGCLSSVAIDLEYIGIRRGFFNP
jgi:hypothetical protein